MRSLPDAAMAEAAIAAEAAEAAQDAFSPDAAMAQAAIAAQAAQGSRAAGIAAGSPIGPITYEPIFGDYQGLSRHGPVVARGPSGNTLYGETVFANLPFGLGQVARGMMGRGDNTFGDFPGDVPGLPSQSELDQRFAPPEPDLGDPDSGDPDSGDPAPAPPAAAPAYVPPVYQTYAGLGLPSISPIPPLRMVTVPISRFVV
jgi:hypothetical protein